MRRTWLWRRGRWRRNRRMLPFPSWVMVGAYLATSLVLAAVMLLAGGLAAPGRRDWRLSPEATGGSSSPGAPLFSRSYGALIQRSALSEGLDPALVGAVVEVESGFNPEAVSSRGARGLMQIMPSTWQELNPDGPCRGDHPPPARERGCIYEPEANLKSGTRYLRSLLDRFNGDVVLALAAYNAGSGAVERAASAGSPGAIPAFAETQRYTAEVLDRWSRQRTGLSYGRVRGLAAVLSAGRWLLVIDALVLGTVIVLKPGWAGGRRR
ncbi:MAG TPA: lytic transglycosylase domain-containing protein [Firmicutes bacterium]|nr:lytic transglycosylase domain-containing protein [Bacillota bacterium]